MINNNKILSKFDRDGYVVIKSLFDYKMLNNFEKEIDKIDGNSKEYVSWLVQGSKGNKVTINAYHPKGGRTSKEIKLIR